MSKSKNKRDGKVKPQKLSVLFVCTGNTCRSPMAEVILRELVRKDELEHRITAGSAGLMAHGGSPASSFAVEVSREAGLDLSGHVSRQLSEDILIASDIVVCMQREHAMALERLEQSAGRELLVLGTFSPDTNDERSGNIGDPFGGNLEEYRQTFKMIDSCMSGLLEYLKKRLELGLSKGKR